METMNDKLDESGQQVNLTDIKKPQNILDLEQQIEEVRLQKEEFVRHHQYQKAARLRDTEKYLLEQLDLAKTIRESQTK